MAQPMLDESPGILKVKPGKLPNCDEASCKLNTARSYRKALAHILTWAGGLHEQGFPPCTFHIVHASLRPPAPEWLKALAEGQTPTD